MKLQPYILAGGLSTRFGSDKASAKIHGQNQIANLCNAIQADQQVAPIVIGRKRTLTSLESILWLNDTVDSQGPLCGIATGLLHLAQRVDLAQCNDESQSSLFNDSWAMFVPCDLFQWTTEITNGLISKAIYDADVVLYQSGDNLHPFPSLWNVRIANSVAKAAASNERSVVRFLKSSVRYKTVKLADSATIASFNTIDELNELLLKKQQNEQACQ